MPSFYQVNRDQAEVLYGKALEFADLTGAETALDLYCGIGTITLCLAKRAGRAIGAEIVPSAIRDAEENAARTTSKTRRSSAATRRTWRRSWRRRGLRPELVTVDPPRKGLAPEVIASIAAMGPGRVVYVSCDRPAPWGRDVKRFGELGYRPPGPAPWTCSPAPAHVETVVLLCQG